MLIRSHATAIFFLLSACHTYSHVNTPEEAVAREGKTRDCNLVENVVYGASICSSEAGPIRVTKTNQSVVTIKKATIVADSLVGIASNGGNVRVAIALKDVSSTELSEINTGRSMIGIMALTGIVLLILIAATPWQ
jgi:hypothetical protein